jgi:hypothetical protein
MNAQAFPLFRTVIGICRFERGPQDLPPSVLVLTASLTIYMLARIVVGLFTLCQGEIAALTGLIDTALLTLTAVVALPPSAIYTTVCRADAIDAPRGGFRGSPRLSCDSLAARNTG